MLGQHRLGVIAGVAVLVGIAGLIFMLARAGAPSEAADPAGRGAFVVFTSDGKLKQPVGYAHPSRRSRRDLHGLPRPD